MKGDASTAALPPASPVVEGLARKLGQDVGRCIADYELIAPGDRVMVCLSGGKDSYALLYLLERARRRAPIPFELVPVHLDQGHPGYDGAPLVAWCRDHGFDLKVLREDTYQVVTEHIPPGKTYCSLCSRLRRGILYNAAEALGCTKIALGHHGDDAIETLLLNLFFAGSLGAMPPKLVTKDGRNTVIRPLLYAKERDLAAFADAVGFPILPCDLCGSQEQLQRKQVKRLVADLEGRIPGIRESMLGAMAHVKATHLLDRDLWKAMGVRAAEDDGDATSRASASPDVTDALPPPGMSSRGRQLPVL